MEVFKKMGLGGAHMHVRVGLATEYLGDEFMQMVKACVDKAKSLDMLAWLYDEDRWPSGTAGGMVTKDECYRGRYLLFADHIPFAWNEESHSDSNWNEQARDYIRQISRLREKYKNKIEISIGYETEYYPNRFEDMIRWANNIGAEYLILGQHFLYSGSKHTISPTDSIEELKTYVSLVVDAIRSGYFTYIAHPDVFNFVGNVDLYRKEMRRICIASREMDVPLEINFLGLREKRNYPNEKFWQVAGEEKSPVTFGFDAHEPIHAYDGETLVKAQSLVEKHNLNYIGKPRIILL